MFRPASSLRLGALLFVGAFAVHQLRYLVAYGGEAGPALAESGHTYLAFAEPLIAITVAFLVGHLASRLLAAPASATSISRTTLVLLLTTALLTTFTVQELLEGQLASGHDAGLAGVFGAGGWTAAPLCVAVAAVLALLIDLTDRATEARVLVIAIPRPPLGEARPASRYVEPQRRRAAPLAGHLAGRSPPALLSHRY